MSGDPVECREQAKACADMASKVRNPDHKRILTNLAQTWLNLAIELERNHALLHAYPEPAMTATVSVHAPSLSILSSSDLHLPGNSLQAR
jgi:hypothetical protein